MCLKDLGGTTDLCCGVASVTFCFFQILIAAEGTIPLVSLSLSPGIELNFFGKVALSQSAFWFSEVMLYGGRPLQEKS